MSDESGFAERLAYVRWLRSRGRIAPESDRELAQALGVGEQWLRKWKSRPDAPDGRKEAQAIAGALAPLGVTIAWLYDEQGPPPEPALWAVWSGRPVTQPAAIEIPLEPEDSYEPVDLPAEPRQRPRKRNRGA